MTPLALWAPKNYTPEVRNVGFTDEKIGRTNHAPDGEE
jgi:hypothetical protein